MAIRSATAFTDSYSSVLSENQLLRQQIVEFKISTGIFTFLFSPSLYMFQYPLKETTEQLL